MTVLEGQEGFGISCVWPRTIERKGAEPAEPGMRIATKAANTQTAPASTQARVETVCLHENGIG